MNQRAMRRERLAARRRTLAVLVERRLTRPPAADPPSRPPSSSHMASARLDSDGLVLLDEWRTTLMGLLHRGCRSGRPARCLHIAAGRTTGFAIARRSRQVTSWSQKWSQEPAECRGRCERT